VAHAVRREVDAGAHLAQRRGLLAHRYVEAVRDQRIGGEQAADAAADDQDRGSSFSQLRTLWMPLDNALSEPMFNLPL
jgi:hypothetical protein